MAVLAIDQGTSATKAVVVGDDGLVLGIAEVSVDVFASPDGGVELDPMRLWQSVVDAGRRALDTAGNPTLLAVGLANQGETVMPWDRSTGAPHGPAIVWQDRRADEVCRRLATHAPRLAHLTGLELDPYFVAPKITWLRERTPPSLVITTTDTWLLHQLCGAFVTDIATAGRSLLLDLELGRWSHEACEVFGIDLAELPAVVGNAEPIGHTDAFAQGRLNASVPVTGACVDQQAALFAEACHAAGQAKCTYGTGAFVLACTGHRPTRSTHGLVGCPAWQIEGRTTWCLDGQVYTAGAAVSWLIDMGVMTQPSDLDILGGSVADSAGVTFVPALAGLAAPWWKPQARAAFTGLSLGTERAHLVRAAIDGIAAQVALLAQAVGADLGAPLTTLRVDGGLTRSRTLLQVQADLLQCPVEVYPSPHATALGVAAFASIGAGVPFDVTAWRPSAVVEPSIAPADAAERLAAWRRVADATMDQ
jgi:glycerol kinase